MDFSPPTRHPYYPHASNQSVHIQFNPSHPSKPPTQTHTTLKPTGLNLSSSEADGASLLPLHLLLDYVRGNLGDVDVRVSICNVCVHVYVCILHVLSLSLCTYIRGLSLYQHIHILPPPP